MPGRFSPPMPDSDAPQWCSSALTSVPSGCPGAGCTTSPAGLFTTITSPSSYTTSSGMSCGATAVSRTSGTSTVTVSPGLRYMEDPSTIWAAVTVTVSVSAVCSSTTSAVMILVVLAMPIRLPASFS